MTREQANIEAKELAEEYTRKEEEIMERAKKEGKWLPGLDSNEHLFKELKAEVYAKLDMLRSMIDEE